MSQSDQKRIYYISPWRSRIFAGIGLALILPMAAIGVVQPAMFVVCALIAMIWGPCYYLVATTRLILSSDGVEFKQIGYRLASPWQNVARIWLLEGQEGFELREPMDSFSAKLLSGTAETTLIVHGVPLDPVPGEQRRHLVQAKQFIPIEAFAYWFQHGDLLEEIRRYAPDAVEHAVRPVEAAPGEIATPRPSWATRDYFVVAIVVGALALGLLMATNVLPVAVQRGIEKSLTGVIFVCLALYALANMYWTVGHVRNGRWGRAVLGLLFALIQILFCAQIASTFLK